MSPVNLQVLEDLKTLHQETLFVLLRFYLGVDKEVPLENLPILLGEVSYPIDHSPKDFSEVVTQILFGVFRASLPTKERYMFMVQKDDDSFCITTHTKKAIEAYILKYKPLPKAILCTNREWKRTLLYKNRFGKWDDF